MEQQVSSNTSDSNEEDAVDYSKSAHFLATERSYSRDNQQLNLNRKATPTKERPPDNDKRKWTFAN